MEDRLALSALPCFCLALYLSLFSNLYTRVNYQRLSVSVVRWRCAGDTLEAPQDSTRKKRNFTYK